MNPPVAASPITTKPLTQAFAHNDEMHKRPLLDALDRGFCSIEADVILSGSRLLAAHDIRSAESTKTLTELYLAPLSRLARSNGGRVFPSGPDIVLLIDIKNKPQATYDALKREMEPFRDVLTEFHRDSVTTQAVTIVLSGDRIPAAQLLGESTRYAALDGRLDDLDSTMPVSVIPMLSDSWPKHFAWRGKGPMSPEESDRLKSIAERTHCSGRRLRFWATPESPQFWSMLLTHGVDLISTDDLDGLQRFLLAPAD